MSKSILTKYENISAFSPRTAQCQHHLIFGRGLRQIAEEDGCWIPLTDSEHNMSSKGLIYQIHENPAAEKLSKMLGQMAVEHRMLIKELSQITGKSEDEIFDEVRERFRKRYKESYL